MFCPSCGLEERQTNQFCRACGADLRSVRTALERPDKITSSAVLAREEIGRAVAAKIREIDSARDLKKVAEDVLPQIEKFLESPEQKRLRRVRGGIVVASIGLGAAIAFSIAAVLMGDAGVFFVAGLGLVTLFIGLSLILNALLFTVPKKSVLDKSPDAASQHEIEGDEQTNELVLPESNDNFVSVIEHTTKHLKEKQPIPPRG